MKVGDYVRNQFGIAKIINIENTNGIDILTFDKNICYIVDKKTGEIKRDRLFNKLPITNEIDPSKIKSSPNRLDLIEIGDIVRGRDNHLYEVYAIGKDCVYINNLEEFIFIEYIKSIVTQEQFESMEYKVG